MHVTCSVELINYWVDLFRVPGRILIFLVVNTLGLHFVIHKYRTAETRDSHWHCRGDSLHAMILRERYYVISEAILTGVLWVPQCVYARFARCQQSTDAWF